jgi:hypothetical protein
MTRLPEKANAEAQSTQRNAEKTGREERSFGPIEGVGPSG